MTMSPALLLMIIQGVQAAISAAPGVIEVATKAKELIQALFTAKLITKQQQDATFLYIDAHAAMVMAGITLPHWMVEPDPV